MRFELGTNRWGIDQVMEESGGGALSSWKDFSVTAEDLRKYKATVDYLYASHDEKHRADHIARVLVLASVLAARIRAKGASIDMDVVFWSVVLHDAKSNGCDNHAELAADTFYPNLMNGFSSKKAHHITNIIRWHSTREPQDIPWWVKTPEFFIVTGADALDLVRMEDGINISVVIPEAWELRGAARVLYKRSDKSFDGVLAIGEEVGLLAHC